MNIQQTRKIMLKEKEEMLLKYQVTEGYLVERIANGEKEKKEELIECRKVVSELNNIIEYLKT